MIGGILKLGGLKSCHRKAATKTIPRPVNDVQHDEGQSSAYHPWHSHRPGFNIAGLEKNSEAISKQSKNWINLASSVLSKNSTLARNSSGLKSSLVCCHRGTQLCWASRRWRLIQMLLHRLKEFVHEYHNSQEDSHVSWRMS